jgi:hypothetical protein
MKKQLYLSGIYTACGPVSCIARQGIHLHRTEGQHACFIARQGIHLLPVNPLRGIRDGGACFSIDMISLTGNPGGFRLLKG